MVARSILEIDPISVTNPIQVRLNSGFIAISINNDNVRNSGGN